MIKIEKVDVYGFEAAIRGMRNPLNSWDKSDSGLCKNITCENCSLCCADLNTDFVIGKNDFALMKKLVAAGSDHSKFMRMINVTLDVTAPLYWWKEADTYKVGTVRNSCSTMHKITEKEFTLEDFSHEHLTSVDDCFCGVAGIDTMLCLVADLNEIREAYIKTNDKKYWRQIIQLLPSSYNQRATLQLNYAVLRNMYHSRKEHKLDEWRDLCKWIETLPYSELITM